MTREETLVLLFKTGLISAWEEVPFLTDEPKIHAYVARQSAHAVEQYGDENKFGYGYSRDRSLAALKASAECIERLSLSHVPGEDLVRGNHAMVDGAVDPVLFLNHPSTLQEQSESTPRVRDQEFHWWPATDQILNRPCLVPAQMVFLRSFPNEFPLRRQHLSTGGAFGKTGTGRAFQTGLFEIIERDASISAYLKKLPLRRIADLPEDAEDLVSYLRRYMLEPFLFDATTDLEVPTVLTVTIDRSGLGPSINIGCRTAETYQDAMCGALLESVQARRSLRLAESTDDDPSSEAIVTYEQRVRLWSPVERIADLDFWLASPAEVNWKELKNERVTATDAVKRLAGRDYHVFVADITVPEARGQGFEVLRVVVPELHPLYLDEGCKVLYSPHHGMLEDDPSLLPHPII